MPGTTGSFSTFFASIQGRDFRSISSLGETGLISARMRSVLRVLKRKAGAWF